MTDYDILRDSLTKNNRSSNGTLVDSEQVREAFQSWLETHGYKSALDDYKCDPYPPVEYIPFPEVIVEYGAHGKINYNSITINRKGDITMKKSKQEFEFEKLEAEKRSQCDAEIEAERERLREEQKKDEFRAKARERWYLYSGLIEAGFSEDQAMSILLKSI